MGALLAMAVVALCAAWPAAWPWQTNRRCAASASPRRPSEAAAVLLAAGWQQQQRSGWPLQALLAAAAEGCLWSSSAAPQHLEAALRTAGAGWLRSTPSWAQDHQGRSSPWATQDLLVLVLVLMLVLVAAPGCCAPAGGTWR